MFTPIPKVDIYYIDFSETKNTGEQLQGIDKVDDSVGKMFLIQYTLQ